MTVDSPPEMTADLTLPAIRALIAGLRISRTEQALATHFIEVMHQLYPHLRIAVRLFAKGTSQVKSSAVSEQPSADHVSCAPVNLTPQYIPAGKKIPSALLDDHGVILDDEYVCLFPAGGRGIDIPMFQDLELIGIVNLEWDPENEARLVPREAFRVMVQLLEGAVINRRWASDTSFFRGRLQRIIANANALIFMVDVQRRVQLFNNELSRFTGQKAERILGSDLLEWLPLVHHDDFTKAFERALAGDWISNFEMSFIASSGGTVRAMFNLASLADFDATADTVIGIGQDSSTLQILKNQVIQAEKLATLGQLAAGIVHEINNPLTSIAVYTDYLTKKFRSDGGDPADLSMLKKIMDGADRILKCARDLVNYAKPTKARLDDLSINDILAQAISFCEHILKGALAVLSIDLTAENPRCQGVQDQLQQLFINLITNACHALPPQGGEIRVSTECFADGYVAVKITDKGKGIPPSDLHQIFEPFFTTKRPGEGTGLGLSIVKRIVDFHKGAIEVDSSPNEGTTFTVKFPTVKK